MILQSIKIMVFIMVFYLKVTLLVIPYLYFLINSIIENL